MDYKRKTRKTCYTKGERWKQNEKSLYMDCRRQMDRTMKYYLKTGLDGIITNYPQNVNKVLQEFKEKSKGMKYRLATLDDDPFRR